MTDETTKLPLPREVMIWKSNPEMTHVGSWATTRYPEGAQRYVSTDALEAQAEQAAVVKPLEWRYTSKGTDLPRYEAEVKEIGYTYTLAFDARANDDTAWMVFIYGNWDCHPTIEAAKAAAQADYERRILSAITIRSETEIRADERAKVIEEVVPMMRHLENVVGGILSKLDDVLAPDDDSLPSIHSNAQTPDWFVEAARASCYSVIQLRAIHTDASRKIAEGGE